MRNESTQPGTPKIGGMDKYEVGNAARTLQQAMKIRRDKKLLAAALKVIQEEQEDAQKVLSWADNLK